MNRHVLFLLVALLAGFSASNALDRIGCFKDNEKRVWENSLNTHDQNTPESCVNLCQGFAFAGLQNGDECWCGNSMPPRTLPDSRCNKNCPGGGKTCGGVWALEVFSVDMKPAVKGSPVGCYEDNADRVWKTGRIHLENCTPQRCFDACRGFRFAGLQNGDECFCENFLPPRSLPRSRCRSQCNQSPRQTCGGAWALEVFELDDSSNPQDNDESRVQEDTSQTTGMPMDFPEKET